MNIAETKSDCFSSCFESQYAHDHKYFFFFKKSPSQISTLLYILLKDNMLVAAFNWLSYIL